MTSAAPSPFGVAPMRTPVLFDPGTSGLRIGEHERRVADPSEPSQVCAAYLSLLYAVRRAQPGEQLALRSADLEALRLLVGDDPETLEQRLIGLMGCSPQEARALGTLLLRSRRVTATLGIAAGLSLGTLGVVSQVADEEPVAAPRASTAAPMTAPITEPAPAAPFVGPVAAPVAPAEAPAPAAVAPPARSVVVAAPAPARRLPAPPPAPVVPLPAVVVAVPVAPVQVVVAPEPPAYDLPLHEEPVLDSPPPVEEEPASAIGDPAVLDLEDVPLTEIGGVTDSDHAAPVTPVETVVEDRPAVPPTGISPPLPDTFEELPAPADEPADGATGG